MFWACKRDVAQRNPLFLRQHKQRGRLANVRECVSKWSAALSDSTQDLRVPSSGAWEKHTLKHTTLNQVTFWQIHREPRSLAGWTIWLANIHVSLMAQRMVTLIGLATTLAQTAVSPKMFK